jgi:leucyl-tRNA synthetase
LKRGKDEFFLKKIITSSFCAQFLFANPNQLMFFFLYHLFLMISRYGQTNCWVLPSGEYGAYEFGNDIFICTNRAAQNMAYQTDDKLPGWGEVKELLKFTGQDVIGGALHAPLTPYEKIYVLPMMSVLTTKGTGVVTSVPSDSPDDFTALRELISKPDFRKKFGVTDEMVLPFKVINIINIPGLGDCAAQTVVEAMKIKSPNDRALLEKAKDEVYGKGFYEGRLIVGPYAGSKVEDVKSKIRDELVAAGVAMPYAEPASEVISRSGDVCVVALIDQWYLDYGEKDWLALAQKCLANMNTFGAEARQMMETGLAWMTKWACSRSFGLGTRLPWDEIFLIDSLSDSTIYMAYYTVAHLLHTDLEGHVVGPAGIASKDLTDATWDYMFLGKDFPIDSKISKDVLDKCRSEFTYWYPVDLRVSGKDLVNNHLLFWIYNHVALFGEEHWPRGLRPNGHVLLNKMKMAKQTGNFISLYDGVERFSADGMRFALADAGDGITDANFTTDSADGGLLKLFTQLEWIDEILKDLPNLRSGDLNFLDKVFANQITVAIDATDKAFANMEYKEGLKTGFFELQTCRDTYQDICALQGEKMHSELIQRFIRTQALLLTPICPHWADYVWTKHLKEPRSIMFARYPVNETPVDQLKLQQYAYLERVLHAWRLKLITHTKPKKGPAVPHPQNALIVIAKSYPVWHELSIRILEKLYKESGNKMPEQAALLTALRAEKALEKELNKAMAITRNLSAEFETRGEDVFSLSLPWDEITMLKETATYISKSLKIQNITMLHSDDSQVAEDRKASATPGNPSIFFLDGPLAASSSS